MDAELKQQLDWIIANLNAMVANQDMIYVELKKIEEKGRTEE